MKLAQGVSPGYERNETRAAERRHQSRDSLFKPASTVPFFCCVIPTGAKRSKPCHPDRGLPPERRDLLSACTADKLNDSLTSSLLLLTDN